MLLLPFVPIIGCREARRFPKYERCDVSVLVTGVVDGRRA